MDELCDTSKKIEGFVVAEPHCFGLISMPVDLITKLAVLTDQLIHYDLVLVVNVLPLLRLFLRLNDLSQHTPAIPFTLMSASNTFTVVPALFVICLSLFLLTGGTQPVPVM